MRQNSSCFLWQALSSPEPTRCVGEGRSRIPNLRIGSVSICALSWMALLFLPVFAIAQGVPKVDETQTIALRLRAVGPPVPSFRYELIPAQRELVPGNAALLHHRAMHFLSESRPSTKEHFEKQEKLREALDGPLDRFPKEEVRAFLRPHSSVYREMEAAVKCDHCAWGIDQRVIADGIGVLLPEAQKLRELAFLLRLRCRLHLADGKFELALKDIQSGLVLAQHAAQGPTLIHFLVGNALATMFIMEFEQTIQSPDCPSLYWSLTALPRPLLDLRKGMEGEIRSMEATIPIPKGVDKGPMTPEEALAALDRVWAGIAKLAEQPESPGIAQSRMSLALYVTLQHPTARKTLLAAGKAEAELDAMPPAQVVMLDALIRFRNLRDEHFVWYTAPYAEAMQGMRLSNEKTRAIRKNPPLDLLQTMLSLMLPATERIYGAQLRTERRLASLRVVEAVRLHAYRNDGKLPTKLSDVTSVPVPVDPTTNQAFEYVATVNSFTVTVPPPPGEKVDRGSSWKYVVTIAK